LHLITRSTQTKKKTDIKNENQQTSSTELQKTNNKSPIDHGTRNEHEESTIKSELTALALMIDDARKELKTYKNKSANAKN